MTRLLILMLSLFGMKVEAAKLAAGAHHIHYALTMNFNPLGNFRYGIGDVEFGLIQAENFGVMFLERTPSPIFMQIGLGTSEGGALIVGGGLEESSGNWFRWRSDVTVSVDKNVQTNLVVTLGGIFLL